MHKLTVERAKAIYRAAIDPRASDAEGDAWWDEVRAELHQVLSAPTLAAATAVIAWWHHDWSSVNDAARDAARRIRLAARAR